MGAPLVILLGVVVGGLGTIGYAFSHTQWKCACRIQRPRARAGACGADFFAARQNP